METDYFNIQPLVGPQLSVPGSNNPQGIVDGLFSTGWGFAQELLGQVTPNLARDLSRKLSDSIGLENNERRNLDPVQSQQVRSNFDAGSITANAKKYIIPITIAAVGLLFFFKGK